MNVAGWAKRGDWNEARGWWVMCASVTTEAWRTATLGPSWRRCYSAGAYATAGAAARQPQHGRVLHVRIRHDDRRRLARPDGRLAVARRSCRRDARLSDRRAAPLSDRAHLRTAR